MSDERKPYDLSPALLRQRRNLMVISLTILFMVIAGAKIDTVTVAGVQMTFKNPGAIVWFLKLFLLYFLYRYYLYLIQEPAFYSLKEMYYGQLRQLTWQKIQAIKDKAYPQVKNFSGEYDFRSMEKTTFFKRTVKGVVGKHREGQIIHGEFEINILVFIWDGLRAFVYTAFNRSYVTDYLLPFIVALAALATEYSYFVKKLLF